MESWLMHFTQMMDESILMMMSHGQWVKLPVKSIWRTLQLMNSAMF